MFNHPLWLFFVIFLFLGFLYQNTILVMLVAFIGFVILMSRGWVYYGKRHIHIFTKKNMKASFKNNPFQITYTLENRFFLPFTIIKLNIPIHRDIIVENLQIKYTEGYFHIYELQFSLPPKARVSQTITCTGKKRGNYLFGETKCNISDPFSIFSEDIITYSSHEIGIYPEIIQIKPPIRKLFRLDGNRPANQRIYEDRIMPKGAREYHPYDPFYKIDWKQTGKTGKLFTKEFEYTAQQEVWLIGNLKTSDSLYMGVNEKKVEQVISTIASLAYLFSNLGTSYMIMMNITLAKTNALYKLYASSKKDLGSVLLQLAKLKSYKTVPFIHAIKATKENVGSNRPIIVLVSSYLSEEVKIQLDMLKREKYQIIWMNPDHHSVGELNDE